MTINSWLWVLETPEESLTPEGNQMITKQMLGISLVSSSLSYALASTYMDLPRNASVSSVNPFVQSILNSGLTAALFILMIVFIYQILKVIHAPLIPFKTLLSLGAVAIIPLHLMLPLALVCYPLKMGGVLIYGLGEMAIGVAVLRRMAWGLQSACGWPLWAAGLLVLSPFLIACLGVLLLSALLMMLLTLTLLGLLV